MRQVLGYLCATISCIALGWSGLARVSAAECFLAAFLAIMLVSSIRFYWVGKRLRSLQVVHQPLIAKPGDRGGTIFCVTLKSDWPITVLWLRVTAIWTRTGGEGGVWRYRRLLFPRRQKTLVFTSSFAGAPRGVYELDHMEIQHGDIFGWFKHNVAIPLLGDQAPVCIIPPAMSGSDGLVQEQSLHVSRCNGDKDADSLIMEGSPMSGAESAFSAQVAPAEEGTLRISNVDGHQGAELRAYRAGDPWRSIDWRTYVKRRVLSIRVPEVRQLEQWDIVVDDTLWRKEWNMNANNMKKYTKLLYQMEETLATAAAFIRKEMEAGHAVRLIWISDGSIVQGAWNALIALAAEQVESRREQRWNYNEWLPSYSSSQIHRQLVVVSTQNHSPVRKTGKSFAGLNQVDRWLHVDGRQKDEVNRGEYRVYSDSWTSVQG